MKKEVMTVFLLFISMAVASAACDADASLLNQDPYPAIPGDSVKLVFQLSGLDSPDCGDISFELLSEYPIEFNSGENGKREFKEVDYVKDYETSLLIPYEVRIQDDALDGVNEIDVKIKTGNDAPFVKSFNIEIDNSLADFEIHVKDYDYTTKELTLEILNIESSDAEALVVEIPKQNNIVVKGSNRVIVGDVDSNEYTTAEFEATPSDGEITLKLTYSDTVNIRRTAEETITFDSSYFTERAADQKTTSKNVYFIWVAIIALVVWWAFKKFKKKKK